MRSSIAFALITSLISLVTSAPLTAPPEGWSDAPMPKDILRDTGMMRSSLLGHAKFTVPESFRSALGRKRLPIMLEDPERLASTHGKKREHQQSQNQEEQQEGAEYED